MSREAMQMALQALELLAKYENPSTKIQVRKPKDGGPIVTMYPHKVATEAAALLRERLSQPEQEPVAWTPQVWRQFRPDGTLEFQKIKRTPNGEWEDYTAPPKRELTCVCGAVWEGETMVHPPRKREWVGLKDEQVEDEWERITGHSIFCGDRSEGRAMHISPDEVIEFSRAIEAKLKERNV